MEKYMHSHGVSYSQQNANKNITSNQQISKSSIIAWLKTFLPELNLNMKIEDLGKGVVYCRIINHFFPGYMALNRIVWAPKN
jgi:hypothetical protein